MANLKFKTNINCGNCVRAVTPHLDKAAGIDNWSVDTANPDKILTVETDDADVLSVQKLVEKAGFKAEPIQQS